MFRNLIMLLPALAFALPFVASQPSMARPLATPTPHAEWGDRDDGGDEQLQLEVCMNTQIFVGEGDSRSYSCGIVSGPQCLSRCTAEAVAPLCLSELSVRSGEMASCQEEHLASCRSQCDGAGAAFCEPKLEARGLLDDDDDNHWKDDDDDDHGDDTETIVFIEQETCFDLDLEN